MTKAAQSYVRTLQQVFTEGEKLLPRVTGMDLQEGGGVRTAQDLIEKHCFDF